MENNKDKEVENAKGCLYPMFIVLIVMLMSYVTISTIKSSIREVEAKQDTILKAIRGNDLTIVDSVVDSTATDSTIVDDTDDYCEDCDKKQSDDDNIIVAYDRNHYDGTNIDLDYTYVYVCSGRYAKKFHIRENCMGLQNCSGSIDMVLFKDAKRRGLTPCRRCIPRPN